LKAFGKISKNPVGYRLLSDLNEKIPPESPLVIFPHDFCSRGCITDCNVDSTLHGDIAATFPHEKDVLKFKAFELLSKRERCFIKSNRDWKNCIIFFKISEETEKCVGFNAFSFESRDGYSPLRDDTEVTLMNNIVFQDDVCLFHELNHARHFFMEFPTCWNVISLPNKYDGNLSLSGDGLKYSDGTQVVAPMPNAEEELQLTGYTVLSKQKLKYEGLSSFLEKCHNYREEGDLIIVDDPVNEIAYRFNSSLPIHFPYNRIEESKVIKIKVKFLRRLLKKALQLDCSLLFMRVSCCSGCC
jgi:hypothetical protein